jgi:DNA-binding transcriptional regulator YiaG
MKYESDIAEMIHENATENFKLGFISEARMREYDELCLVQESSKDNSAKGNITNETTKIEQVALVTA